MVRKSTDFHETEFRKRAGSLRGSEKRKQNDREIERDSAVYVGEPV